MLFRSGENTTHFNDPDDPVCKCFLCFFPDWYNSAGKVFHIKLKVSLARFGIVMKGLACIDMNGVCKVKTFFCCSVTKIPLNFKRYGKLLPYYT